MIKLRAVFEKKDRAIYISHLDLNRCMLRTFRRSKLPIWYTEGFNPHPYFSFALALSLGFESSCEILDFNLNEEIPFEQVKNQLNAVMPDGMRILTVSPQKKKITEIAKAEYRILIQSENSEDIVKAVESLMNQNEILIEKKTKKGMKTVDLKPSIELLSVRIKEDNAVIRMRLPAGTQTNYNPILFLEALTAAYAISFETLKISRTGILCENNKNFS